MAGGSTAALICDTGALLDYLVKDAPDHQRFRHAIDRFDSGSRASWWAERGRGMFQGWCWRRVDYFLRDERPAMKVFMEDLARGAFTYAAPSPPSVNY